MYYFLVWVRSNRYHSSEPLTYSYNKTLTRGAIVTVELQQSKVLGFVIEETKKPKFKVKPIEEAYSLPPLPGSSLKLAKWLINYYPAPLGNIGQQFLPDKLPKKIVEESSPSEPKPITKPALTSEQKNALDRLIQPDTYLLHGITGSGKTRLYIEAALKQIDGGRSAIILSPEIGLSSQLERSFKEVFNDRVITIHSRQTPSERRRAWLNCLSAKTPMVVIGPRSALFVPLANIGLIVIDEFHDSSYKQDQQPKYQTVRVASALAEITQSILVLGSATPSVTDYFLAKSRGKQVIELKSLATIDKAPASEVSVIDIKDRSLFTRSEWLSNKLIDSITSSLKANEQSLLYLNRRGTLRLIVCQNCGWEATCPNCNLHLTYHGDLYALLCHTCGYKQPTIPSVCPNCKSTDLVYTSAGTKAIVDEVQRLFPKAVIGRYDSDNRKSESLDSELTDILSGKVDILIGTQQIAKGLDLPKLSTVGVLQADTSLYLPDYSSKERSFQLITQVLGRINRGHIKGKAFIQTHTPSSVLWQAAIKQDYDKFYEQELTERKSFLFPPFTHMLKLVCRRSTSKSAQQAARKLMDSLTKISGIQVEGPAPAFHEKSLGKYQWQLVVKSTQRSSLTSIVKGLPAGWAYDIDPINLL